jgi:starch-binding outer membrane protein, SusD/RagB family
MRMVMTRRAVAIAAAAMALSVGACSLDLQNPNSPTEEQVTTSADGVIALATGLQGRFANSYFNFAYMAGLVTDEFASGSSALVSISDAEQGSVAPGTAIAENVFNSIYRTVRTADDLLAGSDALANQFEPGTRSGLRALAFALKAEALGEALQSYQEIPIETATEQPTYVAHSVALARVRELLESAAAEIAQTAPSSFFNANIMTPGASLSNIIHLFRARYARMANDDAAAIAASNLVARSGPTAVSVLTFPPPAVNFYANVTTGVNVIGPRREWRLSMNAQDQRDTFFVRPSTVTGRVGAALDTWASYVNTQAPLPVYFPDEALLIKAEARANQGDIAGAIAVLDSVRTDCTGGRGIDDPKACLPPYAGPATQADVIADIYTQRRYELFATGLRWEDARRRGAVRGPAAAPAVPVDAQRCWLPYAIGDRNANTNVPADPAEPTTFPASCPVS